MIQLTDIHPLTDFLRNHKEHIKRLKKEADVLMDQGRHVDALGLYARAYELTNDPALLYNQGRALEAMGEYPDALEKLERFDREASPALRSKVPGLHELIGDLRFAAFFDVQHLLHLLEHGLEALEVESRARADLDAPVLFPAHDLSSHRGALLRVFSRSQDIGGRDLSLGHHVSPYAFANNWIGWKLSVGCGPPCGAPRRRRRGRRW